MKKQLLIILAFCLLMQINLFAKNDFPKREFRGAWVASVSNLDWPKSSNPETQQSELRSLLNELKAIGINAIVLQIRSECDALYESTYEPWSYWLTKEQGTAPDPFYDPLEFAVAEAHKRGMELHAWFNPYRAVVKTGNHTIDPSHVSKEHPDWILTFGTLKILDPGLPMVRDFVTTVVLDVVERYDVDGVHFDDYFYPYPPNQITDEDDLTFANYSRGFTNRGNWRRDNINLFIEMVYDSIQVVKPHVKLGVSPFGIWKNGVPSGIVGLDAYNVIYCDGVAWLNKKIVDYLTPQLYWPFGGGQDYGKLLPWWASQTKGRHLYPGQAAYRISSWSATEMPDQIRLNRETNNVWGSVFFRALNFRSNPKGFSDSLRTNLYLYPSLSPIMSWKETEPPNEPQNVRYEQLASLTTAGLVWDSPLIAADGDTACKYVIYRFDKADVLQEDIDDARNIIDLSGERSLAPKIPPETGSPFYYAVTSLDRNSNESALSNLITVEPPPTPVLAFPANNEPDQPPEVTLLWYYPENAVSYLVQVTSDSTFNSEFILDQAGIADTFKIVAGLDGQEKYYWRVKASNAGGYGGFSEIRSFVTGFPVPPMLVSPAYDTQDISIQPTLIWRTSTGATSFCLQISKRIGFAQTSLVLDTCQIADTTFSGALLNPNTYYYWRASASNSSGTSSWSEIFKFKTGETSLVAENSLVPIDYKLHQSYPNPFNASTTISFDIPKSCRVVLKIYDELGREVSTVLDQIMKQGRHKTIFDASNLSSGIYFSRLFVGDLIFTGKMMLLK